MENFQCTAYIFNPRFRQLLVDDQFDARCLHLLQSLAESVAVVISSPRSAMSSLTLSVHLFGCLPTFQVPSIWHCIALDGSYLSSILVTWPNYVSPATFKSVQKNGAKCPLCAATLIDLVITYFRSG